MQLTHLQKVRMARKMRTQKEIVKKTPLFQTEAWEFRADIKHAKQIKQFSKS